MILAILGGILVVVIVAASAYAECRYDDLRTKEYMKEMYGKRK